MVNAPHPWWPWFATAPSSTRADGSYAPSTSPHRVAGAVDTATLPPAPGTETSIVAALRSRLTAKDAQIAELKATIRERDRAIAVLHGELDKLHTHRD
jgi:hypothetical protein